MSDAQPETPDVIDRLLRAMNDRDVNALVDCFDPSYRSDQPAHPDRWFHGTEHVRKNWSEIFAAAPDLHMEILDSVSRGHDVWTEVHLYGTRSADASQLDLRGVVIWTVRGDRIAAARQYLEEVERAGAGIDVAVARIARGGAN